MWMRQGRDRLPHCRKPLRLEQRLVIARLLHRQGRLVGDRDGERQVVGRETTPLLQSHFPTGDLRVEVEDTERLVAPLHRHADHLADAELDDAAAGVEPGVLGRVGKQHPLLLAEHPVDDRPAQEDLLLMLRLPPANRPRLRLVADRWSASRSRGPPGMALKTSSSKRCSSWGTSRMWLTAWLAS